MTTRADSEVLTSVGAGTPVGNLMREYWIPAAMSSELRGRRRPDAADAAGREAHRLSRQHAAGSASWTIAVRTAAPRCSSDATRMTGCAAPITAGSSMSTAIASTCRTCRRIMPFRRRSRPRATRSFERNGLIWTYMGKRETPPPLAELRAGAAAGGSDQHVLRAARMQLAAGAWKATSIPRISASCTLAA